MGYGPDIPVGTGACRLTIRSRHFVTSCSLVSADARLNTTTNLRGDARRLVVLLDLPCLPCIISTCLTIRATS